MTVPGATPSASAVARSVQVLVEAQHDHRSLPRGEPGEGPVERQPALGPALAPRSSRRWAGTSATTSRRRRRHHEMLRAHDHLPRVGLRVAVRELAPAQRDLGQRLLHQVLGALAVAGHQDRGAQQRGLPVASPNG